MALLVVLLETMIDAANNVVVSRMSTSKNFISAIVVWNCGIRAKSHGAERQNNDLFKSD